MGHLGLGRNTEYIIRCTHRSILGYSGPYDYDRYFSHYCLIVFSMICDSRTLDGPVYRLLLTLLIYQELLMDLI
jgi:hypothetical protein